MLFDLQDAASPTQLKADVCIVGAGPAGITIAKELIASGLMVCLAESGGFEEEADTQALYDGTSVGRPMALTEGRYRMFGGSATRWGGKSVPLDPIDFEKRDWIKNSGWPITLATLQPYYERAKTISNFHSPWLDDASSLATINRTIPDFQSDNVRPYLWHCATPDFPITWKTYCSLGYKPSFDWARSYGSELFNDRGTAVVLHANLVKMTANDNAASIKAALFKSLNGHTLEVRAKHFIIACSGIENARIALNLPDPLLQRLNQFDNVGRYFAQHPGGPILSIKATKAQSVQLQKTFNIFSRPPRYPEHYILGFALTELAQREHELLNASAMIQYTASEDSAWASARRLKGMLSSRQLAPSNLVDLKNILANAGNTVSSAFKKYISAFELILPQPRIEVLINLEQEPNPESRVRLSDRVDALGVRCAQVDWRLSEIERKTALFFAQALAPILQKLALGQPELAPWLLGGPLSDADLGGNYHFIGATRMASTPDTGVVDKNCRAFGVNNLFFAGASVFPTGSHANPTLTIIALAVRLADLLRSELAARAATPRVDQQSQMSVDEVS